jgi:hypothetical protein
MRHAGMDYRGLVDVGAQRPVWGVVATGELKLTAMLHAGF